MSQSSHSPWRQPVYDPDMSDTPPPPPAPEPAIPAAAAPPTPPAPAMPPPLTPSFAPSAAIATADSGPVGKPRSALLIILLTIVTLGVWQWIWSFQNGEELKRYAKTGVGGVGYLFITIFIYPITMFLMASEVEQLYRREGKEPPITTIWGLWFLLPLIGNLIWYLRIQKSLNEYWVAHGASA